MIFVVDYQSDGCHCCHMNLLESLDRLSPFLCRVLARNGRKPLAVEEIAERSGISGRTVIRLSKLHSWKGVRVGLASRYIAACGLDPLHKRGVNKYLKQMAGAKRFMPHIKSSRQRKYFARLAQPAP